MKIPISNLSQHSDPTPVAHYLSAPQLSDTAALTVGLLVPSTLTKDGGKHSCDLSADLRSDLWLSSLPELTPVLAWLESLLCWKGEPSAHSEALTLWIRFTSACAGFCHHFASLWGCDWAGDGWCLVTLRNAANYCNYGSIGLENCVSHTVRVLLVCFYKLQMSFQRSEERQSVCPMEYCSDLCPSGTFSHLRQGALERSHRDVWAPGHVFYANPFPPRCSVWSNSQLWLFESSSISDRRSDSSLKAFWFLWMRMTVITWQIIFVS